MQAITKRIISEEDMINLIAFFFENDVKFINQVCKHFVDKSQGSPDNVYQLIEFLNSDKETLNELFDKLLKRVL